MKFKRITDKRNIIFTFELKYDNICFCKAWKELYFKKKREHICNFDFTHINGKNSEDNINTGLTLLLFLDKKEGGLIVNLFLLERGIGREQKDI